MSLRATEVSNKRQTYLHFILFLSEWSCELLNNSGFVNGTECRSQDLEGIKFLLLQLIVLLYADLTEIPSESADSLSNALKYTNYKYNIL